MSGDQFENYLMLTRSRKAGQHHLSNPSSNVSGSGKLPAYAKRKRGRPRVKEVILQVKRPVGRPRKELNSENDALPLPKRKVGRPPKIKGSGGIVVEFGPIVSI